MSATELGMFIGGIVVLVVLLGLLVYCVVTRRSYKPLLLLFPIPIIMIGFSRISSFKFSGAEVDMKTTVQVFTKKPFDPTARADFNAALEKSLAQGSGSTLQPDAKSNLVDAVDILAQEAKTSPESRLMLSKAQFVLGETNKAVENLRLAHSLNTNLVVSPYLTHYLMTTAPSH